ncbi:type II toxin-antitoxin system RelE/ParE family toxin [Elusimicrobiota bacterium]
MRTYSTPEFNEWLSRLDAKARVQVDDRLDRIREYDHFGDKKHLNDELFELRWTSGRRVYYSKVRDKAGNLALLLMGGGKSGQKKDIKKARRILEREAPSAGP